MTCHEVPDIDARDGGCLTTPTVQDRSGRVRKISPPPGFEHRTIQHVATRYNNEAIPASDWNNEWWRKWWEQRHNAQELLQTLTESHGFKLLRSRMASNPYGVAWLQTLTESHGFKLLRSHMASNSYGVTWLQTLTESHGFKLLRSHMASNPYGVAWLQTL